MVISPVPIAHKVLHDLLFPPSRFGTTGFSSSYTGASLTPRGKATLRGPVEKGDELVKDEESIKAASEGFCT